MSARVFAVVGPSGVGKDTLMEGLAAVMPVVLLRRVITRAAEAGGEVFEGISGAEFLRRREAGAFALDWEAHGLRYGVPRAAIPGEGVALVNLSRRVLPQAAVAFPGLGVFHVVAAPEVLAQRLAGRGRESAAEIAARLGRAEMELPELPGAVAVTRIDNSGPPERAIAAMRAVLQPASA